MPLWLCLGLVPAAVLATVFPSISLGDLPRGSLWTVVRACVAVQHATGVSFPCSAVADGPDGFVILHVPGTMRHFLVVPRQPVAGLESATSHARQVRGAWRAALDFRAALARSADVRPGNVALSINPRRARGQDQLHIHMDCVNLPWAKQLRALSRQIGRTWTRLPEPIDGAIFWVRRIDRDNAREADPLTSLMGLPLGQVSRINVVLAAFGLSGDGNDLLQVATQTAATSADDTLDDRCGRVE